MEPLLEKAKLYIPARYWDSTPIALKATAGLRLLPGDQANAILNEVCEILCFVINLNKGFCDVVLGDRKQIPGIISEMVGKYIAVLCSFGFDLALLIQL